jgi:hypothetical protein
MFRETQKNNEFRLWLYVIFFEWIWFQITYEKK